MDAVRSSAAGLLTILALPASLLGQKAFPDRQAPARPVMLAGVPETQLIRWPSITLGSDTVFVAANVFPGSGDSLHARPAYLGRLRRTASGDLVPLAPLDLPRGEFQFAYPRVIAAGSRLHLVWSEFGLRPRTSAAWENITSFRTSLWHAMLEKGVWTRPEKIATSVRLEWNEETGDVAIDASGALHVAFWDGSSGHVHHLRFVGGAWEPSRLPYGGLNSAMAIAIHGDTMFAAVMDAVSDTERVWVVESADHGKEWKNPTVVSSRPRMQRSVSRLAFATTRDGLLLAIGEKAENSFYLDTIRLLRLDGSGRVRSAQFVPPPPQADQFVLAGTSCGSVVILTRSFSATPRISEITIPRNSLPMPSRPLLDSAGLSLFPAVAPAGPSVIAAFVYNPAMNTRVRNAAMPIPVCSP